jgi:hypothetical protein
MGSLLPGWDSVPAAPPAEAEDEPSEGGEGYFAKYARSKKM